MQGVIQIPANQAQLTNVIDPLELDWEQAKELLKRSDELDELSGTINYLERFRLPALEKQAPTGFSKRVENLRSLVGYPSKNHRERQELQERLNALIERQKFLIGTFTAAERKFISDYKQAGNEEMAHAASMQQMEDHLYQTTDLPLAEIQARVREAHSGLEAD